MTDKTPQILPEKPGEPGGEKALELVLEWLREGEHTTGGSTAMMGKLVNRVAVALAACELEAEKPLREALEAIANDQIVGNETLDPAAHWYREIAKRALERAAEGKA